MLCVILTTLARNAVRRYTQPYPNHRTIDELVCSIQSEIKDRPFNCTDCDWSGNSITVLNQHVATRHFGLKYPCEECEYVALTKRNLQVHRQEFEFQKYFYCSRSPAVF